MVWSEPLSKIELPKYYACKKCGRIHSEREYAESMFCLNCGTFRFEVTVLKGGRTDSLAGEVTEHYCRKYSIPTLYHITPMENLPLIMRFGLLSHNRVKEENLPIVSCSNADIQDKRSRKLVGDRSVNDYVPLFFSEKPPMLWPIERDYPGITMVYICIKGEIIGEKGVCFSDGNIANSETTEYVDLDDLAKLDWKRIQSFDEFECSHEEAKRIKSAEVLVPSRIDSSWFQKLVVPHQEAKIKLETLIPHLISIPIEVRSEFYHNPRSRRY